MGAYYIIFSALASLSLCNLCRFDSKIKRILLILLCIVLSLFAGLRCDNADWDSYSDIFLSISNGNFFACADVGFDLFLWILSVLTNSPLVMFLGVALISVFFNVTSFNTYSRYVFLCALVYFVHNYALKEMIQIRVGMASALCLYSVRYLEENKFNKFRNIWIIAVTIHFTALVFGIVYFSAKKNIDKKLMLNYLMLSLIIGSFFPLGQILKSILGINERLDAYIAYGNVGYGQSLGIWNNLNTLKGIIVFCFLYHYYNLISIRQSYFKILFYSYTVGLCWLICFNDFAIIGARISSILLCVEPVLLTYPLYIMREKSKWLYVLGIVILAFVMLQFNMEPNKITPYNFYFSNYEL